MKIWHYHPVTREYLGEGNARRDPEDDENHLIPADATTAEPPLVEANEVAQFDLETGDWQIKSDWRGLKYWTPDGDEHLISEIGLEPSQDALYEPPPPPAPTLAEEAELARARRDAYLRASDWTQVQDAPLSEGERQEWRDYRQALRDVPGQPTFPAQIEWPSGPGGVSN